MTDFSETSRHLARLVRLQVALLDYTGHVRRGLPRDEARILVDEIQRVRAAVGWKPLDMSGRWKRRK